MSTNIDKNEAGTDKVSAWLNDPMGSVVAATASVFASFAVVLTGIGMISMAV